MRPRCPERIIASSSRPRRKPSRVLEPHLHRSKLDAPDAHREHHRDRWQRDGKFGGRAAPIVSDPGQTALQRNAEASRLRTRR